MWCLYFGARMGWVKPIHPNQNEGYIYLRIKIIVCSQNWVGLGSNLYSAAG